VRTHVGFGQIVQLARRNAGLAMAPHLGKRAAYQNVVLAEQLYLVFGL
jgi:hypothetical protein